MLIALNNFEEEQLGSKFGWFPYKATLFVLFVQYFIFTVVAYVQLAYYVQDLSEKSQGIAIYLPPGVDLLRQVALGWFNQELCQHFFTDFLRCFKDKKSREQTQVDSVQEQQELQVSEGTTDSEV